MEKRKQKNKNNKEEPVKKKRKWNKHGQHDDSKSDMHVQNSGEIRKVQTAKDNTMKRKMFKHEGKDHSSKKMETCKTEKSVRKPVSMQTLLSEKLKVVQQNRIEKSALGKTEAVVKTVELKDKSSDIHKTGVDTSKPVATDIVTRSSESAEPEQKPKKSKKDKKKEQKNVIDKVKESASKHITAKIQEVTTESQEVTTESQEDNTEEEDPEKAAIRKKKREKRRQKKLEKERIKQQNIEKAGTANQSAVEYLKQWKNNREEWKFMKVRQVWLLQNIYNQALIDDESFEILLEYLEGLQGKSKKATVLEAEKVIAKADADEEVGSSAVTCDRARQVIQLLSDE